LWRWGVFISALTNHNIRLFFGGQTMALGVLSPPVLADGFCRIIQPIPIREQSDQFDGTEEFHVVGFRPAERPQFSRAYENPPPPSIRLGEAKIAKTAKTAVVGISLDRNGQCDLARLAGGSSEE
jgi:hypothetical protein